MSLYSRKYGKDLHLVLAQRGTIFYDPENVVDLVFPLRLGKACGTLISVSFFADFADQSLCSCDGVFVLQALIQGVLIIFATENGAIDLGDRLIGTKRHCLLARQKRLDFLGIGRAKAPVCLLQFLSAEDFSAIGARP